MEMKKIIRTKTGLRVTHINRRRACRLACTECMGWESLTVDSCDGKMLDGSVCSLINFRDMNAPQNAKKRNTAIRSFCSECMGGYEAEVTRCTSFYCPLHPYRQTKTDKATLFSRDITDKTALKSIYDRLRA